MLFSLILKLIDLIVCKLGILFLVVYAQHFWTTYATLLLTTKKKRKLLRHTNFSIFSNIFSFKEKKEKKNQTFKFKLRSLGISLKEEGRFLFLSLLLILSALWQ